MSPISTTLTNKGGGDYLVHHEEVMNLLSVRTADVSDLLHRCWQQLLHLLSYYT